MSSLSHTPQQKELWQRQIGICCDQLQNLLTTHGLSSRCLGHESADLQLWSIGQQWLQQNASETSPSPSDGPDVYLVTQLYTDGGHTPLIGDFVRALEHPSKQAPHLILTNHHRQNTWPLELKITQRTHIPTENFHCLDDGSVIDRLDQLFQLLLQLRPGRLFLFHHPGDPLPCIVSHPTIASQRVLVHHADAIPSFGLHLPGIKIIDLNPYAAAFSRIQNLHPHLLPLTCPDPGSRPPGFLQRGHLVTASCGSTGKFRAPYHLRYHETVAFVLQQTQGWHIHIGALEESDLLEIRQHLQRRGIAQDRFEHVPWTPSLVHCLWEHQVDVYIASFPITGARTKAEVTASSTPHLSHQKNGQPFSANLPSADLPLDGDMDWTTWDDLAHLLSRLSDTSVLQTQSTRIRAYYERSHHPLVFKETLLSILQQNRGWLDPDVNQRDQVILQAMLKSIIQASTHLNSQVHPIPSLLQTVQNQQTQLQWLQQRDLEHQSRIDFLQAQRKKLRGDLDALQQQTKKRDFARPKRRSVRVRLKDLFRRVFRSS